LAPLAALVSGRPDVAPWLLPDDWFGRPPGKTRERTWQRRKSPRVAMLSSFLVPGLGQLYNEREFWALVAAGTEFYFIGTLVAEQRQTNRWRTVVNATGDPLADVRFRLHRDNRTQATWLYALTALLSGLQSYVDAHMSDFDDSPLPLRTNFLQGQGPAAEVRLKF
jgi:TM2 domain-containing membrane protein YozV